MNDASLHHRIGIDFWDLSMINYDYDNLITKSLGIQRGLQNL